jgi:hypothetical protein
MAELALKTKDLGFRLEQVQDFTPTPMTVATEIYATGVHPYDGAETCVARSPEEKQEQRSFFFWYKPEMRKALRASMKRLGLGGIARRLLDEKRKTEDVTPPLHITPCGFQIPEEIASSKTPVFTPGEQPTDTPVQKKKKQPRMEKQKPSRNKRKKTDPRGPKPEAKSAAKPAPFQKFFKKR